MVSPQPRLGSWRPIFGAKRGRRWRLNRRRLFHVKHRNPVPASTSHRKPESRGELTPDKTAALALTPVSRETEARLDRYVALLMEWQAKINLVAPSTLPHLWTRHISDSLQVVSLAQTAKVWVDLGSGGGFPGVVLACALAETPGAMVHLVERTAKKAAFLREAVRVTSAAATVHLAGIGDIVDRIGGGVDCVTARALAPLHQLVGFAEPFVSDGAKALFLKG